MTRVGPAHLVAGKSRLVSFWLRAQRMKCPAGPRWLALAAAVHSSRSPCGQEASVSPRAVSQFRNAAAAAMFRRATWAWPVVAWVLRIRWRSQAEYVPDRVAVQDLLLLPVGTLDAVSSVSLTTEPGPPERQARAMYEYLLVTPVDRWPSTKQAFSPGAGPA